MSTLLLTLASLALPQVPQQGPPPALPVDSTPVVAFESVSVVPMDRERILDGQTVVVRDGKIAEIGPSDQVQVPEGAVRVNGRGKYLMPGIAEMHAHVPAGDDPLLETYMALYVLTGATTVRAMLGTPDQLDYRKLIASGQMLGPTLFAVGPPFTGSNTKKPEDGEAKVREYHSAGFDVLKILPGLKRETYDAILKTARELNMPISGHVPTSVGVRHAIESGQSIEHLDGYLEDMGSDRGKMAELVQLTTAAGIWNCPTMDVWKTVLGLRDPDELLRDRPEVQYLPRQLVDQWTQRVTGLRHKGPVRFALEGLGMSRSPETAAPLRDSLLKALSDGGARLLLGSDSPQVFSVPGFSLAHEMDAMVAAGLSTWTVLSAATRNPAEFFGRSAEFGTVEVGKRADLLLVDGNPLDDIRNVHRQSGVMLRGRWLSAEEINRQLAQIAARWKAQ